MGLFDIISSALDNIKSEAIEENEKKKNQKPAWAENSINERGYKAYKNLSKTERKKFDDNSPFGGYRERYKHENGADEE